MGVLDVGSACMALGVMQRMNKDIRGSVYEAFLEDFGQGGTIIHRSALVCFVNSWIGNR